MPDKWEKYAQPVDKWEKYAEAEEPISLVPGTPHSELARRFTGAVAESLNPVPMAEAFMSPRKTAKGMFAYTADALGRAREALSKGQYGEAAKSALGAIPVAGPMAESLTREVTGGQLPEAAGHAAGFYFGPKILKGAGMALEAGAPPLAESALGIRALDRAYGRRPGLAALEETSGVRPGTVSAQAETRLRDIDQQLEHVVGNSSASTSLQPALDVIDKALAKATAQNEPTAIRQLTKMREGLTTNAATGLPLSPLQVPKGLLNLKRGFGNENVHNWNPETMKGVRSTGAEAYHALAEEGHRAVPESAELDRRASSLIPVAKRAESAERGPALGQRIAGRVAAHTGALAGAALGYHEAGLPGAVAGLVIPEIISSPETKMIGARALHGAGKVLQRPLAGKALRGAQLAAQEEDKNGR